MIQSQICVHYSSISKTKHMVLIRMIIAPQIQVLSQYVHIINMMNINNSVEANKNSLSIYYINVHFNSKYDTHIYQINSCYI